MASSAVGGIGSGAPSIPRNFHFVVDDPNAKCPEELFIYTMRTIYFGADLELLEFVFDL
jgi:hypothetical protein